ncbi:MAG TPA: radical SAM protein [bacterium]|nr:radical SAM protein [bacterium]
MLVNDIYRCNQGEGQTTGTPSTLLRLQGCPLKCDFCDSMYAVEGKGKEMSVEEVIKEVGNPNWLIISGGEPMVQLDSLDELIMTIPNYMNIEIQTSGHYPPPGWYHSVNWTVDYKCPSSGVKSINIDKWFDKLSDWDSIKFVVSNDEDLQFVLDNRPHTAATLLVSPVMWDVKEIDGEIRVGKEQLEWIRKVAMFSQEQDIRLSIQTHRFIYGERNDV